MSHTLVILVTFAYAGVSISELQKGNYPMAIVFFGYALANIGLISAM